MLIGQNPIRRSNVARAHRRARREDRTRRLKTCSKSVSALRHARFARQTTMQTRARLRSGTGRDGLHLRSRRDRTNGRRRHDYDDARLRPRRPRQRPSPLRPGRHCREHRPSLHVQCLRRNDRTAQRDCAIDRRHKSPLIARLQRRTLRRQSCSNSTCEPASTTQPTAVSIG